MDITSGQPTDPVTEVFGETGILSKEFDGYKPRAGQMELSRAVLSSLRAQNHLLAEGPTGTGKSFAYLVPAIYHAVETSQHVVVATANIALQEQLVQKDLPFLKRVLPVNFEFCLFKGKNNYLCEDQLGNFLGEQGRQASLFKSGELSNATAEERKIVEWAKSTKTGDKSELPLLPHPATWSKFSVGADECKGKRCKSYNECHAVRARARASRSHIIVCNFHVLFANLKFMGALLPPFDICILDEAHEAADIARDFLGYQLTGSSVHRFAKKMEREFRDTHGIKDLTGSLSGKSDEFFESLRKYANSKNYDVRIEEEECVPYMGVISAMEKAEKFMANMQREADGEDKKAGIENLRKRLKGYMSSIESAMELGDENVVHFIEAKDGRVKLSGKPINVAALLRKSFFTPVKSVVMTSATLSVDEGFDHVIDDIGIIDPDELIVESPFTGEQSLFVVPPKGFPLPNDGRWLDEMAAETANAIRAANGRTLCLFTSYRSLNHVRDYLRAQNLDCQLLSQGDGYGRTELVQRFKDDTSSVLLGTRSFWAGVDVPGESLSLVTIDKLPFPSPGDPVLAAMQEILGKKTFFKCFVPRAIILFKQGAGRLIRSVNDRGVILCFDRRLKEKGYGKMFLNSLPEMPLSTDMEDIWQFLGCQPWGAAPVNLSPDEDIPF